MKFGINWLRRKVVRPIEREIKEQLRGLTDEELLAVLDTVTFELSLRHRRGGLLLRSEANDKDHSTN